MTYQNRWLLAVAMKQPYPNPNEAGALDAETKLTQSSIVKIVAGVGVAGLLGYWLLK